MLSAGRLMGLRKYLGLVLFVVVCLIGPALAQVIVSRVPAIPKGTFSLFEAMAGGTAHVESTQWYLAQESEILVTGIIRPTQSAAAVSLEINGESYTEEPMTLWGPGGFRTRVPLVPGATTVLARGPWGSRAAVHILYTPEQPLPIARSISMTLSAERASVAYTAVYTRDAYAQGALDLPSSAVDNSLFVRRVFYPDATEYSPQPADLAPSLLVGEDVVVTVSGDLAGRQYSGGNVNRILGLTPRSGLPTTVTLLLDGVYMAVLPRPAPTDWRGEQLRWVDPAEPIAVQYELRSDLQPGGTWLRDLWTNLQGGAGRVSSALNLILLPLVPVVPFLWLLHPRGGGRLGAVRERERRNLLLVLVLLMWLVPIAAYIVPFPRILHRLLGDLWLGGAASSDVEPLLPRYPPEVSLWGASLAYILLLPWAYRLGSGEGRFVRAGWIGLALAALLLNLLLLLIEGYLSLTFFPAAAAVLLIWTWLLCEIGRPGRSQFRRVFGSWSTGIGLAVAVLVLAVPFPDTASGYDAAVGWQPRHWAQFYFTLGALLLPYTIFPALLPLLKGTRSDRVPASRARPRRSLGLLLFATYVIGFLGAGLGSAQWIAFNLIPFAVAVLWVYPGLVERGSEWDFLGDDAARTELDARPISAAELRRAQWDAKGAGGQAGAATGLPDGYQARKAVFALGPTGRPWENAKLSVGHGLMLSLVLFSMYSPFILSRAGELASTPFPLLQVLGSLVLPFFAKWLLASFLLGYFFSYIRGESGLQKGLVLALGMVLCTLPSNALLLGGTMGDPLALLWEAGQTILFLSALGLWAFDWNTARRYGLGWSDVLSAEGLGATAPFLSSLVAAISGVASSIISGRADEIIRSVLELLLRGAPPFS
jgi:hypothetical protein